MAVESRIDADDEWFVGEDRLFRFKFISGDTTGIAAWPMTLSFYSKRAAEGDTPLASVEFVGEPGALGEPAYAVARVPAEITETLGAGIFKYVLRRTDVEARAVLAFGPAELRSAVSA